MALNDTSRLTLPTEEDETPRSPRAIRAIALAGVPELAGTEADVAAALPIRERLLIDADDFLSALRSNEILTEEQADTAISIPTPASPAEVLAAQQALNRLRHQTDAAWWIGRREATIKSALNDLPA